MKSIKCNKLKLAMAATTALTMTACSSSKPLEVTYINDGEMTLSIRKTEKSEISFQLYREGAAGATGGKSSGGCGCN